jgi:hypothetical protein
MPSAGFDDDFEQPGGLRRPIQIFETRSNTGKHRVEPRQAPKH